MNAINNSEKDYGIVEASMIQKTTFSSPSSTKVARKQLVLRTVQGARLLKVRKLVYLVNSFKSDLSRTRRPMWGYSVGLENFHRKIE